ncbi:MAG: alpha/beta fold hydrolase [Bacteroidota bacterium]
MLLLFLVALGVVSYLGLFHIAPYAIIQPYRAPPTSLEVPDSIQMQNITFQSHDNLKLQALSAYAPHQPVRGVMILVHGIGSCKEHMNSLAIGLAAQGIACFWADGRAQGQSEGKYCTYGYFEKQDIQALYQVAQKSYPDVPIGIWGNSLGGAIALQALELEEGLAFGIIQSTFTDLDQIVYDYQKRYTFGVGAHWATRIALREAGEIAGFPPAAVCPIESARQIEQPVLIAHGDADKNISVEYGKQLYETLASEDKELVIVAGGGHNNLGNPAYWERTFAFIDKQLLR